MKLKKTYALVVCALLVSLQSFAYSFMHNSIAYNILSDGKTLAVTYRGSNYSSNPYTGIITIPSSVEYGGKSYTVTEIGVNAFANCHKLTRVYFPETLLSIGDGAFNYCNYLEGVNFPDGLLRIGTAAFRCCFSLTRVYIPSSVISIGFRAFEHCPRLKLFQVANANANYASTEGGLLVTKDGSTLVIFPSGAYNDDDASNAAKRASATDNGTFVLPENITRIMSYAFSGTEGLRHAVLHKDVVRVGSHLFSWCADLEDITVAPENTYITSVDGVLYSKSGTAILEYPNAKAAEYTIAEGVTRIFHAFDLRTGIKSVTLPSSIKTIDSESFQNCALLSGINLPEGLTTIGDYAFSGSGINAITIPSSVETIGRNFVSAKYSIRMLSESPSVTLHEKAFSDIDTQTCKLVVPNGSKANYTQSAAWSGFSSIIEESEIPDANISISALKDKYWQDDVNYATEITEDLIVKGVVTSSDETGNIYKSLYIMDETGSLGFMLNYDKIFSDFPLGQEMLVSLKGLHIGKYCGAMGVGEPYYYTSGGVWEITVMDYDEFKQHVQVYSRPDQAKVSPVETSIDALNFESQTVKYYSGQLVKICGVRFKDADGYMPFAFPNTSNTRIIVDEKGNQIEVVADSYATWSGELLPTGTGDVTGILVLYKTPYNGDGVWRLKLRDNHDCENFDGIIPEVDSVVALNEDFEGGSVPSGWKNVQVAGDKAWYTPSFNNNYYAAMTGYRGTAPFDSWLISPAIDIARAENKILTFRTQVNSYGSTTTRFEVYLLNTSDPRTATLTELYPTLATAPASGYSDWEDSGDMDLSAYSGTYYIGFRYYATTDANCATWCIDDVKFNIEGANPNPTEDNRADLETLNNGRAIASFGTYTTTDGWSAENCNVLSGGSSDANPTFRFIGYRNDLETEYAHAACLNGNSVKTGSILSPLLKNGIKKLKFNYGMPYSNDNISLQIEVLDKDLNVKWSETLTNEDASLKAAYIFEREISGVTSNFRIKITNNCPSGLDVNKDHVAVWNLVWESAVNSVDDLGIDSMNVTEAARYTLDGRKIGAPVPGINIVRYSNGATRKEVVR